MTDEKRTQPPSLRRWEAVRSLLRGWEPVVKIDFVDIDGEAECTFADGTTESVYPPKYREVTDA